MKKSIIYLLTTAIVSSCTLQDFDEDINKNPNVPSEASAPQLLSNAMLSLTDISSNTTGNFFGQYLAETQYAVASRYPQEGTSFYGWYQGPLINVETVLNTSTIDNQLAVAKILKAYFMWHVTDRWGDVPYSEALQGSLNFTPSYDTQESIYRSLFALLDEAQAQINTSGSLEGDIMYGGNMGRWKKFANTLRMLMALRLSEVDASTDIDARAEFNAALADGIMVSNNDSFAFGHLNEAIGQNYWYERVVVDGDEWWAVSSTLVDIMNPVNDPRLPIYADPARNSGDFIGLPMGTEPDGAAHTENYSLIGSAVLNQDQPVYLVTYAQALFAKAEAAARGWTGEDAETNYYDAIENSIDQWTGSTDDVAAYLAETGVVFNPASAIEQIATQRYIHLFLNGYEAWSEWRRTGFPAFVPSNGNAVPLRQSYVANESFNNTENYNAAVQRQFSGQDLIYGQVWWDQ